MHFVVMCDEHAPFASTKCMTYPEGSATPVSVALEVEWGKIVM